MWKDNLNGVLEIANYIMDLDGDMSREDIETFLYENYGECIATLKELPLSLVQQGDPDRNISSEHKQILYNKQSKNTMPPILLKECFTILDGHHRYRSSIVRGDESILAYVIQSI